MNGGELIGALGQIAGGTAAGMGERGGNEAAAAQTYVRNAQHDDDRRGGLTEWQRMNTPLAKQEDARRDAEYNAGKAGRDAASQATMAIGSRIARIRLQEGLALCDAFLENSARAVSKQVAIGQVRYDQSVDDIQQRAKDAHLTAVLISGHEEASALRNAARGDLLDELKGPGFDKGRWISKYLDKCAGPSYMAWFTPLILQMSADDLRPVQNAGPLPVYVPRARAADYVPFSGYDAEVARNRANRRDYQEQMDRNERNYRETMDRLDRSEAEMNAQTNQRHYEESQRRQEANQRDLINAVRQQNMPAPWRAQDSPPPRRVGSFRSGGFGR